VDVSWLSNFNKAIPELISSITAVAAAAAVAGSASALVGSWRRRSTTTESSQIADQLRHAVPAETAPQYALLREYHAQGLSQSRISFWFSLVFASLGFAIIAFSIVLFTQQTGDTLSGAGKPVFTLVAGTVIDAVSALFFVQSNKVRQLMTDFFDKLRTDRKLDESLKLVEAIGDAPIGSNLRALLAINFAEIQIDKELYDSVLLTRSPDVV
jgi:hypothetical protein